MTLPKPRPWEIALMLPTWSGPGRRVLEGTLKYVGEGTHWSLCTPWPPHDLAGLPKRPYDGAIAWVTSDADRAVFDRLSLTCPVVHLGRSAFAGPGIRIDLDDTAIGRAAAAHLLAMGCDSLGVVPPYPHAYHLARAAGFAAACEEHGIRPFRPKSDQPLEQWLAGLPRPTAVFATSDNGARQIVREAQRQGIRVPHDLLVLGAGDDELLCELELPTLSSISMPFEQMGYSGAMVLDRLLGGRPPGSPTCVFAPGAVIERQSTEQTAVIDPVVAEALRFIRAHAREGIQAADVAAQATLSRRTLEVRFRRAVGHTIQDEIGRVRIGIARDLLAHTDFAMPAIAERSGFSSPQRLTEVFLRETQESPTSYRARFRILRPS